MNKLKILYTVVVVMIIFPLFYSEISISSCINISESTLDEDRKIVVVDSFNAPSDDVCFNIETSNFSLTCENNVITSSYYNGIFENINNTLRDNVSINNCIFDGDVDLYSFNNSRFENLTLRGNNLHRFNIHYNSIIDNITLEGSTFYSSGGENNNISNIYGKNFDNKFHPQSSNSNYENITIINSNDGLSFFYSDVTVNIRNVYLENISSSFGAAISITHSDNNILENIQIKNSDSNGISAWYSQNNVFRNLSINNSAYFGVYYDQSSNLQIYDSLVENSQYFDILIDPNIWTGHCSHTLSNVTVSGGYPAEFYNTNVNIINRELGILLLCNADDSIIENVTIKGNPLIKNNGIFSSYSDRILFNNVTSDNNFFGLRLQNSHSNTVINTFFRDNKFDDFLFYPVFRNSNNINLGSSNICSHTFDITLTDSEKVVFMNSLNSSQVYNNIESNKVILCDVDDATFNNLSILSNINNNGGLYIFNSDNNIFNNITSNNNYRGTYIDNSHNNIFQNSNFNNNYLDGFHLLRSNNLSINFTNFTENGHYGIYNEDFTSNNLSLLNSIFTNNKRFYHMDQDYYYIDRPTPKADLFLEGDNSEIFSNKFINGSDIRLQGNNFSIYNNFFNVSNFYRFGFNGEFNRTLLQKKNIMGGNFIGGNFWGGSYSSSFSENCSDLNYDGVCDSPFSIPGFGGYFDNLPLTFAKPIILNSSIECSINSGNWEDCNSIMFNDTLNGIRSSCSSTNGNSVVSSSVSLYNYDDNKYYFSNLSQNMNNSYWETSSLSFTINDSGDFDIIVNCQDNLSSSANFISSFFVDYGTLLVQLISPVSDLNVMENSRFQFISNVTCLDAECGNVTFLLDPISQGDYEYTTTIINDSFNYNYYNCNTLCVPDGNDDGLCPGVSLGFDFSLFNTTYPEGSLYYMDTNGRIVTSPSSSYNYYGTNIENEYVIASFWSDLEVGSGNLYSCPNLGSEPNRYAVFRYENVNMLGYSSETIDNEIVLHENGDVEINFGNVAPLSYYGFTSGLSNEYYYNYFISFDELDVSQKSFIYSTNPNQKGGLVPMNSGEPFYTTNQNPLSPQNFSCYENMRFGDSCEFNWTLFTTGNSSYQNVTFFTEAISSFGYRNRSEKIFISILPTENSIYADYLSPTSLNLDLTGVASLNIQVNTTGDECNLFVNNNLNSTNTVTGSICNFTYFFSDNSTHYFRVDVYNDTNSISLPSIMVVREEINTNTDSSLFPVSGIKSLGASLIIILLYLLF